MENNVERNVLLVGQIYLDTILFVSKFPEEDTKLRANDTQQRIGGNTCNTAQVLTQFHHINVCYMSAVGSRETSNHIVDLLKDRNIQVNDTILFRQEDAFTPSSTIIHNESSGSRTIISHTDIQDLTCNEFKEVFEKINKNNDWWVHFEGRNIDETVEQINWLNKKAINEHWRDQLIISVELEKPERENIESLIELGDIIFFSKIFAQHHGFKDAKSFLNGYPLLKSKMKPNSTAFCTWGSEDASVLERNTNQISSIIPEKLNQVVDTVGAGDTFNAGVIAYYNKSVPMTDVLLSACNLATKKVSQAGFDNLLLRKN